MKVEVTTEVPDVEYLVKTLTVNMRMLVDVSPEMLNRAFLVAVPQCSSRVYPDPPSRKEALQQALDQEIQELIDLVGAPGTPAYQLLSRASGIGVCLELVAGSMRHWRLVGASPLLTRINQFQVLQPGGNFSVEPTGAIHNESLILEYLTQSLSDPEDSWEPSDAYKRFLEVMQDPDGALLSPGVSMRDGVPKEVLENWYTELQRAYGPTSPWRIDKDRLTCKLAQNQRRVHYLKMEISKLGGSLREALDELSSIRCQLDNMPEAPKVPLP